MAFSIHTHVTGTLPSLPFAVPVPSLVKEEGTALVTSWVLFLPCSAVLRMILGRLMGRVMLNLIDTLLSITLIFLSSPLGVIVEHLEP